MICLYGDLGSGKTLFVQGLAEALGIDKYSIKSPTYVYIRNQKHFYHIDLYRLEEIDELLRLEIEELLKNPQNIIIIEWADRLKKYLPNKRTDIYFKYLDDNSREITTASTPD